MIGGTLTPWEGTDLPGYHSPAKELIRHAVNRWSRTSGMVDAVVDFDAAPRNPANPARMLPNYSPNDHLHPGDAGYQAMADALDPALFTR